MNLLRCQMRLLRKPDMENKKPDLDEEIPYTLRKEKRSFDMFLLFVVGMVLVFSIGGFFTYKTFEIIADQDDRINQLEMKIND